MLILPACSQIHNACKNAGQLDWAAAAAVEARIELDLRIGASFTRMQSLTLQSQFEILKSQVVSYGPCQFPTLGFVVDRYERVENFVPETFWFIHLEHVVEGQGGRQRGGQKVTFFWDRGHLFDKAIVTLLHRKCLDDPEATVTRMRKKPTRKW